MIINRISGYQYKPDNFVFKQINQISWRSWFGR